MTCHIGEQTRLQLKKELGKDSESEEDTIQKPLDWITRQPLA